MSIKTTFYMTRDTAIDVLKNKIFEIPYKEGKALFKAIHKNTISNEELENILEKFEESYFRNYFVVDVLPEGNYYNIIETATYF